MSGPPFFAVSRGARHSMEVQEVPYCAHKRGIVSSTASVCIVRWSPKEAAGKNPCLAVRTTSRSAAQPTPDIR